MKEYHFGIRVTSYMFMNYLLQEGEYECCPIRTGKSYETSHLGDDILSIFIGIEQIELRIRYDDCLKAYFKTDKFRISYEHSDFKLFEERQKNMVFSIFVVENGIVVADYPIHDIFEKGTLSYDGVTITLDKEKLIRDPYMKDFLSVIVDGTRLEDNVFNMPERNLMQYFFETIYAQSYNKSIKDASFGELYGFLKEIEDHVASYDIPSILKDLNIHVSSSHWRDDSYDTVYESRTFSFPKEKLDKYLSSYLGGFSYDFYGPDDYSKENDPFKSYYCLPHTPYGCSDERCGSLGGFNRYEQRKIWANGGNYNEEQVNIVRNLLIERYSSEEHKKFLLKDSIRWRDWGQSTFRNQLGTDFYDILIDPSFFNRIDYLIGASAYECHVKRYQSVNEINAFLNKQLKDCMWLLRRDRLVW